MRFLSVSLICMLFLQCGTISSARDQGWKLAAESYDHFKFSHCYVNLPNEIAHLWFAALPELSVQVIGGKDCKAQLMHRCPPQKMSELRQWHENARTAVQHASLAILERLKGSDDIRAYRKPFFWISPRLAFCPKMYPREGLRTLLDCLQELRRAANQRQLGFVECVKKTGHPCNSKNTNLDDLPDQSRKYKKRVELVAAFPCILGNNFDALEQRLERLQRQSLQ